MRKEKIGVPVTLEIRVTSIARVVNLVFIRIDNVCIGEAIDLQRDMVERMFRQKIILVEKRNETTFSDCQCTIRCG
ncbi:hypothetical protein WS61_13970 [Burkholderia sp. ABCPW 11]|nr:hypothetical protein WS61_13970 [Burkholderia sp. ABCPW 11]